MSGFPGSAPWGWARCCSAPQARNFAGKGTSYAEITAEMAGKHDDNGPLPLSQINGRQGYPGVLAAWCWKRGFVSYTSCPGFCLAELFFRAACVKWAVHEAN